MAFPWDRMTDETTSWFHRFDKYYRPLGPERTIEQAWRDWKSENALESNGKRPPKQWYQNAKKWNWTERAGSWDASIRRERQETEATTINEMLDRHLEALRVLFTKAMKCLEEHEFESAAQAIRGLRFAIVEERKAVGIPTYMLNIAKMSDDELLKRYSDLLTEVSGSRNKTV